MSGRLEIRPLGKDAIAYAHQRLRVPRMDADVANPLAPGLARYG